MRVSVKNIDLIAWQEELAIQEVGSEGVIEVDGVKLHWRKYDTKPDGWEIYDISIPGEGKGKDDGIVNPGKDGPGKKSPMGPDVKGPTTKGPGSGPASEVNKSVSLDTLLAIEQKLKAFGFLDNPNLNKNLQKLKAQIIHQQQKTVDIIDENWYLKYDIFAYKKWLKSPFEIKKPKKK